jgi:hypothetical protein
VCQLTIAADEESVTISDLEIEYEQRLGFSLDVNNGRRT